ncbi:hypothetical protein CBR_g36894 [Chara braunii]|uniref:Ribosomal eL28/Mak16 domain-containing protein n=1 Tax=Chara braunii TaxID=69332 RepID=A0A388LLT0_CHABU|nr:hypothetical protein CBR_g36894 [Chara braunii]|eukprot:GBG83279.1 hypothetical protein CBR_g36894 [Chara braunii]
MAPVRPTTAVSDDLMWLLLKQSNRFVIKQNGNCSASIQFSREPNNLFNVNTHKYSGLSNTKTVGIAPAPGGEHDCNIVLTTTKTRKKSLPKKRVNTTVMKTGFQRMVKVVKSQVSDNHYRPDLKRAALARLSRIHRSLSEARETKIAARKGIKSSVAQRKVTRK